VKLLSAGLHPLVRGVVFCITLVAAGVSAQDTALEVNFDPRRFGIEDVARLVIRVQEPPAGTPEVDLGQLENLENISGPSTGTEFSWINGRSSNATTFSYVLQGVEVGPASVGPVIVRIGDIELRSGVITAEVVPGSVEPPRPAGRRSPFSLLDPFDDPFSRRQPASAARVALRQLVSSRDVVLGQPVLTSIVLDTNAGGVDGFEWLTAPTYPGWWAQRVEPPERVTGEVVEVEGVRLNRFVVAQHVLVPLKTGELTVPAVEARIGFRTRSVFAPQQVVERASGETLVNVVPRTQAPEGFSGAVGNLRYSASLDPGSIAFGESTVLSIELSGNGNLPLVEAPLLWPDCADCESYPPEEEEQVTVDATGIHGKRIWRTTIVPRVWGELELQPVMLAVFDPGAGHYRKQAVGPLHLTVTPPPPTPTPPVTEGPSEVLVGSDDGRESPSPATERSASSWTWILGALLVGLLVGGVVSMLVVRRRRIAIPPRRQGESPAARARELQVTLEGWWIDAQTRAKGRALEDETQQLRRELEAVRFAPGRADHTETVADLEDRVRNLMRRA
jgi:hypothetical protein